MGSRPKYTEAVTTFMEQVLKYIVIWVDKQNIHY